MIEKYAFVNLPKLKYLSLSNNPYLIHVGGKSFGHTIPGIQILKLSNNAIDLLPGRDLIGWFWGVCWLAVTGRTAPPLYWDTKRRNRRNNPVSNELVIIKGYIQEYRKIFKIFQIKNVRKLPWQRCTKMSENSIKFSDY